MLGNAAGGDLGGTPTRDLFQFIGGTAGCRKLADAFYARVNRDPLLRPLFPGTTLRCAIEEFAAFLVQFLDGPSEDSQKRWWLSLRESHERLEIRQEERTAWLENMRLALDDAKIPEPGRGALRALFEHSSAHVVNTGPSVAAPSDPIPQDIASRWDAQRALDAAIAAVRANDAERAIAIAESEPLRARFQRNASVFVGLLGQMIASGSPALLHYVHTRLTHDPSPVNEHYAGRTLLHQASSHASLATVELLLKLGYDPNARTATGHTPLYCLANEYRGTKGAAAVRALVNGGADVNADDGVKRCTPLHMAARRGSVEIAEALLDCGAEIDARDSLRDTPLRRSVNCDKVQVARLLIARGANIHSIGNKRLTPAQAARSNAMKLLFQSGVTA